MSLREGESYDRDELIDKLVSIQYKRNDVDFVRSSFRVRGDVIDIFPAANTDTAIRVEFFGDDVERISEIDALTCKPLKDLKHVMIFPASHYVVGGDKEAVLSRILKDKEEQKKFFEERGKFIEAQRIDERVNYDVEMIREIGYCSGIENYSRYFDGRAVGQPPYTLMDFFKSDYITFIDESHMTIPQIRAMYNGDRARKKNLVDYGFRLPAAYDNRPLTFDEFDKRIKQLVCISATPAEYELAVSDKVVEQLIRPTGLIDPPIEIRQTKNQIDDLIGEINAVTESGGRTLVTTLTKKMAESLTEYLREVNIKVKYMHSDIDTLERIEIIKGLRLGEFDVLVGINLLREGLDLPEVKLVAILDADKEGFLRSETSLVQTVGRAARNSESRVIMYADNMTGSMQRAINETNRRRQKQQEYNEKNGITPQTIIKPIVSTLEISKKATTEKKEPQDIKAEIEKLNLKMRQAADMLDFEAAIRLRDEISSLKKRLRH